MTDVASIITQQNGAIANAQAQMANDFSQINTVSDAITKSALAAGTDEQVINTQQAQGLLAAQDAARKVASSYGGNPDDISFIMDKLGQQWMDTTEKQIEAEKVVQQKQSVSFLDNPLQWLSNKLTVNTDINNYNNLEEQANTEYTALARINQLNTTTAESMKAIAQTQTAATVAATSDLAAQKAAQAANTAKLQGLLYNVKGVQDVTQMGQDQVQNTVAGANVAIAQGHLAVAQAQLGVMTKEMNMKAELYAQEVKDKKAADASDTQNLVYINKGRATMGLAPLPDVSKAMNLLKLGGAPGEAIKSQLTIGAMTDTVGKPIIAASPGGAARALALNQSPIATVNPAVKSVVSLLSDAYQSAHNPMQAGALGINSKDPASVDAGVTQIVTGQANAMAANIKPGDHSNIYQAPPLASIASMKGMQENPLYTTVLKPQIAAGMTETDPVKLLQLTVAAVQNKSISLTDAAAGLASVFVHGAALNTQTKDYTRFGIAPQGTYITTIPGASDSMLGALFGGDAKVDMTNKAQVTTAIMRYMNGQHYGTGDIWNASSWSNK